MGLGRQTGPALSAVTVCRPAKGKLTIFLVAPFSFWLQMLGLAGVAVEQIWPRVCVVVVFSVLPKYMHLILGQRQYNSRPNAIEPVVVFIVPLTLSFAGTVVSHAGH